MNGSARVAKGRIEEAAGALTNNDKLRAKGRTDQAVGHLKQDADTGVRYAKDFARRVEAKAREAGQVAVAKAKKRAAGSSCRS